MAGPYHYRIELKTADESGAGTDANVYVILKGTHGETDKIDLDNDGEDNFEQGKTDTFRRGTDTYIGELWGVELGHDDSGGGSGWKPESIEIFSDDDSPEIPAPSDAEPAASSVPADGGDDSHYRWATGSTWAHYTAPPDTAPLFSESLTERLQGKWLSSDNDGWQGAGEASLKVLLGTRPKEVRPEIRPPKGDWKDYPTGVIAGIRVYNTTGASITTGIAKTVEARVSRTNAETRTTGQEYTESVEFTFSQEGLFAASEQKFGFSATQRKEIQTQLSEMQEASQSRTQEMSFSQQISLAEGQVAVVAFEIYEVRRAERGEIKLGDQRFVFSDFITYHVPHVQYFTDGSDELKQRLREYADDPDTKELVSQFVLTRYAS